MSEFGYLYDPNIRHTDIIVQIVKTMGCQKYLELGVWYGKNITKVSSVCNYCVGVDMTDKRIYRNFNFILSDTDKFFSENKETFDIIFIDANHNFEQVKKDFINSLKILNKHGIIFIHDTDPINEHYSRMDFCGDSYKMINWINNNYSYMNVITLPVTEAGLTIVNRKSDRRINDYLK